MPSSMDPVTVWEGDSESLAIPILEPESSDSLETTSDSIANVEHREFLTDQDEPLPFSLFPFDSSWPAELLHSLPEHSHTFDNAGLSLGNQHLATYNDQPPSTNNTVTAKSFNPGHSSPPQDLIAWLEGYSDSPYNPECEPSLGATGKYPRLPSLSIPDQSVHYDGIHSSTDSSSVIDCSSSTVARADSGGGWKKCVSTPATIKAANRRRKSKNKRLFDCPHCSRNFTAKHNLKRM
ncbi:hypothetical protein K435DRAFT_974302 [Dendrothele bispora CBS 962.96]|uniref:Uncharacterized protein n=1 Tax=Dendrothele bispora (strain CBS 962.96) TaxID=1314807 RepID=A0A4S8KMG4_DENBC|nr:hypothetical protein K435DRAFT_974302 [Dendrothele bispora CBS 962.96]